MHNRVGLGTFPLAGVFNSISREDAKNLVRKFIDLGGYYIDTAPLYGNGEVEKMLGEALKGIPRHRYFLGTKTVKHVDKDGRLFKSGREADVVRQIDNSLFRLNLDHVDLLMVHSPDPDVPIAETLGAMERLQSMGKVRELAVSNVDLAELIEYNKTGKIRFVQNRFSLINRSLSAEFEKYLLVNRIHLLPYHLTEVGQLAGIAGGDFRLRTGDLRENLTWWNTENTSLITGWVDRFLHPIARELGISLCQLNIAWALHQPFIDFVVVGTTKLNYLTENLRADAINLDKTALEKLETAYLELESAVKSRFGKSLREFRGLNEKYY